MNKIIEHLYIDFVDNVSNDKMAISIEESYFIWNYLIKFKPKTILERGMGFSTCLFALYKKYTNCKLICIDTSNEWINITNNFLNKYELNANKCFIWDDFKNNKETFDLIFEDARKQLRTKTCKELLNFLNNSGTIIYDDYNVNGYIKNLCKQNNLDFFNLIKVIDCYKRYPAIATKDIKVKEWLE